MYKAKEEQRIQLRENVRDGTGQIFVRHLLEEAETLGMTTMCLVMTVNPGVSIGPHSHESGVDAEIYYVIQGEVISGEPGHEVLMKAGDVSFTGNGHVHFLENRSEQAAEVFAIIIRQK